MTDHCIKGESFFIPHKVGLTLHMLPSRKTLKILLQSINLTLDLLYH